ncbi:hypothetical protein VTL71DRAFT_5128 [Oculimacula yallundae]|uniref:Uncharacterized protein n=1 Tax=Oculimacula yallundae TaxID=86028 RepID=A0ABR4C2R9_9HELO
MDMTDSSTQQHFYATRYTTIPVPPPNPKELKETRNFFILLAFAFYLGVLIFTLFIHATVRGIDIPVDSSFMQEWAESNKGVNMQMKNIVVFSIATFILFLAAVNSLAQVTPSLGVQTAASALCAACVGLVWITFRVGEEAEFGHYIGCVIWPVAGVMGLMISGASIGILGRGEEEKRKGEKQL